MDICSKSYRDKGNKTPLSSPIVGPLLAIGQVKSNSLRGAVTKLSNKYGLNILLWTQLLSESFRFEDENKYKYKI